MKTGKEQFEFFSFNHDYARDARNTAYIERLKRVDPAYILTRSGNRWQVRFPCTFKDRVGMGTATTECYSTFMISSIFSNKGKKRKRFTLRDWLQMVTDMQQVWVDAPLRVRLGTNSEGIYITEDIVDDDELIIHLKYMDIAC